MGSMAREKKAYATSNASTTSDGDASGIAGAAPAVKRRGIITSDPLMIFNCRDVMLRPS